MASEEEAYFDKEAALDILKNNCDKIGLENISDVVADPAVGKFENYSSDMLRLTVIGETEEGSSVKRSVILKQKKKDKKSADLIDDMGLFKIESMIYNELINAMETVMSSVSDKGEKLWPTMIACTDNKIFLEDLKASHFQLTPKEKGHDYEQGKLVVEGLAKFHALSLVVIQDGMFHGRTLAPSVFARNLNFVIRFHTSGINYLAEEVDKWGSQWSEVAMKLRAAIKDIGKKFKLLWEKTRGKFDVVNHGDCWSNNMMFKFSPGCKSPTNLRFVDFQVCHYNSPGWDLNYYLSNTIIQESKTIVVDKLLSAYADSLKKNCDKFGYRGKVPDVNGIRAAYEEVSFFGTMINLIHTPISIASTEKDFNFNIDDFAEEGAVSYNYYKSDNVKNAMKVILKDLVEQNRL